MSQIHTSAIVHPDAKIGNNVIIEPYAVVNSPEVELGDNVVIKSHAYIEGNVHIGEGTIIYPFASIGTQTQNLKYAGEKTYVRIGKNCQIREYVTINSSCGNQSRVEVGDKALIMAYCHVAHNCRVGKGVIMANGATLAGYVEVGDYANLGGLCAIHQNTRIGEYAMIGGGSMIGSDVPPYTIGQGYPLVVVGLNWIGLKRHNFSLSERKSLTQAFKLTYEPGIKWSEARKNILEKVPPSSHIDFWVKFCDSSKRGIASYRK